MRGQEVKAALQGGRFGATIKLLGMSVFFLTFTSLFLMHQQTILRPVPSPPSLITLVTTYFPLEKAKHAPAEYLAWQNNFFPFISTPMVIYTAPSELPRISALRQGKPTIFRLYPSVWDLPWIKEREPKNSNLPSFQQLYENQHKIDPESHFHSPGVYAVWNSKPWMLQQTAQENPFSSTYFFWMDSGCIRQPNRTALLSHFPEPLKVRQVFEDPANPWRRNRVHAFLVEGWPAWRRKRQYRLREVEMAFVGTFFGGRGEPLTNFSRKFYELHDRFLAEGHFVGKDQDLFNLMLFNDPEMFMVTSFLDVEESVDLSEVDEDEANLWLWLFFQLWYGSDPDPRWRMAEVRSVTEFLKRHSPMKKGSRKLRKSFMERLKSKNFGV